MPSTYTTNLRTEQQATGENRSTWGTKANNVFQLLEDAITKQITIAMSDGPHTLTTANGADDEARCAGITFTGTLTATRGVTIPAVDKMYWMKNATTGGFSLNITNGTNTVSLENGAIAFIFNDGTTLTRSIDLVAGTSGNKVPLLNGNNIWSGVNTYQANVTSFNYNEASANLGPSLNLYRINSSAAASDRIGAINIYGQDDGGNTVLYGRVSGQIITATDGNESGRIIFETIQGGANTNPMNIQNGVIIGGPTGGFKGQGSINAVSIYQNNVPLADMAFKANVNLASDVTGTLPIANGGTGATTAAAARTALGTNNAANLTAGTLPDARLSGTYTGITINTSGSVTAAGITSTGQVTSNQNFISSSTNVVLAANTGTVILRPNGAATADGQAYISTNGNMIITGNLTVSGGSITGNASSATTATTATNWSRSVVAGNGLTGGGAGTANINLAVGQGTGITVAATTVSVDGTVWRDGNQPTTAQISSIYAGNAYGAVGTYVWGWTAQGVTEGTNYAGSGIYPGGLTHSSALAADGSGSPGYTRGGTALSGTWKAMGRNGSGSDGATSTLFLRVA